MHDISTHLAYFQDTTLEEFSHHGNQNILDAFKELAPTIYANTQNIFLPDYTPIDDSVTWCRSNIVTFPL